MYSDYAFSLEQLWKIAGGQLVLLLAALLIICADLFLMQKSDDTKKASVIGWLTVAVIMAALLHVINREWQLTEVVFMGVFSMEKYSAFIVITILMAGILATLFGIGYIRNNKVCRSEYFILLLFALYGAIAMVQSVDLLMMFIALEIMSVAVYVLAAFLKKDRRSQEAAIKYFLLGCFGSAFFLFGTALLYGLTGTVNLSFIAKVLSVGMFERPEVLVALAMIMAGLFFKMAIVPFHMWTPDVYEGSPAVVTGFMATVIKAGAFGAFLKIITVTFSPALAYSGQPVFHSVLNLASLGVYWKAVIAASALLTMFIGNLVAVSQKNVKRMLAYSSIAHAGYMLLGILAANDEGRMGVLYYLFSYTLMNLGAFGVLYLIDGTERNAQTLEDYQGLGYKYPVHSFLMALFLISMAGLPPTAGFISKFYVFLSVIKEGYFVLAALGILTSAIGSYYYLRVIYMLYMKEPVREIECGRMTLSSAVALIFAAIGVLYLGILPEWLAQVAQAAQSTLAFVF